MGNKKLMDRFLSLRNKEQGDDVQISSDYKIRKAASWSLTEVEEWLVDNNFRTFVLLFKKHNIDGEILLTLTEQDLLHAPLSVDNLGDARKLIQLIKKLREREEEEFIVEGEFSWSEGLVKQLPKLAFSLCYFVLVTFITAFTMTLVHNRVPDQRAFPPLPDIFLDNIPLIPWAFQLCEWIALSLSIIFCGVLLFHKHRIVVLWRITSIAASVFLLRCVTMYVTSLSVPGVHLNCQASLVQSIEERLLRAWQITSGLGMSINGVRTCGDYMFSGHTIALTMLTFSIVEYSPENWKGLHLFAYVSNFFGMFFILAAHEHYTIDVVIAFYITSRLFLYYHSIAKTPVLFQGSLGKRMKTIYPVLSYLEDGGEIIENEYEWPWQMFGRVFRELKKKYQHSKVKNNKQKLQ